VETINHLQRSPQWRQMAIIIAYDDGDGWYDHVMPPIVRTSESDYDFLTGDKHCGDAVAGITPGRCGYGPRLPLLVISTYARRNFVDHTLTDQTSIDRFIEDNWGLPRLGDGAMDHWAGSLVAMFEFDTPARTGLQILDPETGVRATRVGVPSAAWRARGVGRHCHRGVRDEPCAAGACR
jgi:phospholipase C